MGVGPDEPVSDLDDPAIADAVEVTAAGSDARAAPAGVPDHEAAGLGDARTVPAPTEQPEDDGDGHTRAPAGRKRGVAGLVSGLFQGNKKLRLPDDPSDGGDDEIELR
jgi:hypothetical protein